jgi:hypothetical protein
MIDAASNRFRLYSGKDTLVVIDAGMMINYNLWGEGVLPGAESPGTKRLVLNEQQDAIDQITQTLHASSVPFASLHIVVSGSPGVLHFASGDFSLTTLRGYAEQLPTWFKFDPTFPSVLDPNIFLYGGRRIGATQAGKRFIDTLSWLTGATVTAVTGQVSRTQILEEMILERRVKG